MGNREGPESPSPSPTRTRHQGTAESNNGGDDSMSVMSDNTNASNLSVWAQAKMILTGQNPNAIVEEPDEDEMDVYVPQSVSARIDSFENNMSQQPQRSVRFNTSITDDDKARNTDPGMHDADFTSESHHVDFLQDRLSDMTWSRRIAVFLMKRYSWYNPRLNHPPTKMEESAVENDDNHSEENYKLQQNGSATSQVELLLNDAYPFTESTRENPRLESAWAYFEHVALPRYISVPKELGWTKKNIFIRFVRKCFMKGNKQLQRAEPGEKELETALYHPIFTPHKQLGDFGLGIGLYFSTLRAITVLMLLAGLLNTANIVYFNSPEYNNPENVRVINETLKTFVQGSAICTDTSWVLCTDCENHTDSFGERVVRGRNEDAVTYFALRNNCEGATIQQGLISYATLLFIMIGTIILNVYLTRMEVAFDEDEQTSQDYSVIVENPPHDATNPQEWHDFFKEKFGAHVTACTVAVDNDLLIRTLVTRRELLRKIELLVDPG